MKKIKTIIVLLLVSAFAFEASAGPVERIHAKRFLRRTAAVIIHAHKVVKEGKVYTGNLARAIAHQHYARKLYREGKYLRAIHHSRRARHLAFLAIAANKGKEPADLKMNAEEEKLSKDSPKEEELDKDLQAAMPSETSKDEDVMAASPDVDLDDKE